MAKTEFIYGMHPVIEALKAARRDIFEIYISTKKDFKQLEEIVHIAEKLNLPVNQVNPGKLRSIANSEMHQGVVASVGPYPYVELSYVMKKQISEIYPLILLLDHISDPQNLGAIIRTALCAGVKGIVIPKDRACGATPAVSKSSAGALEHIALAKVNNMINAINQLKDKGFWIAGLDRSAKNSIFSTDLTVMIALVIGGEEHGIRPLVKRHCDILVSIPQLTSFNSLNASVAGAIAIYETYRQRKLIGFEGSRIQGFKDC